MVTLSKPKLSSEFGLVRVYVDGKIATPDEIIALVKTVNSRPKLQKKLNKRLDAYIVSKGKE